MRRTLKLLLLIGIGFAMAKPKGPDGSDSTPNRSGDGDGPGTPPQKSPSGKINTDQGTESASRAVEAELDLGGSPRASTTAPSTAPSSTNKPRGTPAEVKGSGEKKRSLRRENESAQTLAEHGYDVEQNPGLKPNGKDPDYKIEGEYADCYAPKTGNADNVRGKISEKVSEGQADRIVLNLDDSSMDPNALRSLLERRPIEGLQEIKIIKDGQVTDFYP